MGYQYQGFIPQNIALDGTKKIGVYDANDNRVGSIHLRSLAPIVGDKLYSFGLLSDLHIVERSLADVIETQSSLKLDNAMTFFEEQGADFCCHCGDFTNVGFRVEGDATTPVPDQFAEYKRIRDLHPKLPIYGCPGNHESYVSPVTENLPELETYTGHGLYYSFQHKNDVFVFVGQPTGTTPMNVEELQWLYETLETNRNKRCFVFVHPFLNGDSGNALGLSNLTIFGWWEHTPVFKKIMSHYKNAVLFHGHSHTSFYHQEENAAANYTDKNGFRSVHVPSVAYMKWIREGETVFPSLGYLVDVYDSCIVLRGRSFGEVQNGTMVNPEWLPIATYKIITTLQTIEAGTFVDDTGTIVT